MAFDYGYYKVSADYIKEKLEEAKPGFVPDIGVILGSGLGGFSKRIDDPFKVPIWIFRTTSYRRLPDTRES